MNRALLVDLLLQNDSIQTRSMSLTQSEY